MLMVNIGVHMEPVCKSLHFFGFPTSILLNGFNVVFVDLCRRVQYRRRKHEFQFEKNLAGSTETNLWNPIHRILPFDFFLMSKNKSVSFLLIQTNIRRSLSHFLFLSQCCPFILSNCTYATRCISFVKLPLGRMIDTTKPTV